MTAPGPTRDGAFTWAVTTPDGTTRAGMAEADARALARDTGGRLCRAAYTYPNGDTTHAR